MRAADGGIAKGDGDGGGLGLGDFQSEAGAGESADGNRRIIEDQRRGGDSRRTDLGSSFFNENLEVGVGI